MPNSDRHPDIRTYPDARLMQEIALHNNERAFEVLYDRYSAQMYRYFYRLLWQNAAKSEDFTQDLFLKIIEKPHLYDPSRNFCTWLYTLATNMCKNEYRRKPTLSLQEAEVQEQIYHAFLPEKLDQQRLDSELREAIGQLAEPHRQCFVLRYQEACSVAQIAEIMDCPEGTIKSRLHYALKQITEKIGAFYKE